MDRQALLTALAVGIAVSWLALAVYVVVDDQRLRRQMKGRWARLDQALADAGEHAAIVRHDLQGLVRDPGEGEGA